MSAALERMEPRLLMDADPIWVGGVYVEEDSGGDGHGDTFYITFKGGAPGTELTRLTIDGDHNEVGFGLGDMFFDTIEGGLGADHAFPFQVVKLVTADPTATVQATVADGSTKLVLDFTRFRAGDTLVFSIDVDEVQQFDPNETNLDVLNSGFDPIASGVEFQNSWLKSEFTATHYEDTKGQSKFLNRYDAELTPSGLPLPEDNADGKRDRSAGTVHSLQQVPKPISLGGIVYVDNNYNLTIDSGEQRLSGVTLELYRLQNGTYVSTGLKTTTDTQGAYKFGTELKLQPGIYQVRETQPTGYLSVGATVGVLNGQTPVGQTITGNADWLTQIEIPLGDQHATLLNFAEAQPASLSGQVTLIRNAMDCDDPNATVEVIPGVTVELRDGSGAVIASQLTDSNGRYRFDGLRAGTYTITEITPPGLLEGDAHVGTVSTRTVGTAIDSNHITQIVINGGNAGINYDFCEVVPSRLNGHVYVDENNDGSRDPAEAPIANVTIALWNEKNEKVGQTTTDSTGYYEFINLPPGIYRVTEVQPAGYLPGQATAGTIQGQTVGLADSTGNLISQIRLPSDQSANNYDFGELLPGSISGRVIVDTNGNCILDAVGEMPLQGVKIELLDSNGFVLQTTTTDASGNYKFDGLRPGQYRVRETQPVGYFHGGQHAGSGGGNDTVEDLISEIQVRSGDSLVDYLFCEYPPSEISGVVFVDRDADCFFDTGEAPIEGTRITLHDGFGNLVAATTTDANGRYRFTNLRPGNYTIREEQPAGYLQGGQVAGSGGGDASQQDVITSIPISAGQTLVDYNFCEVLPASISGKVFVDLDFDCIQDANEQPLSGVTIELLDPSGSVLATTTTDADGKYSFVNLKPGNYTVRETQPIGYFQGGTIPPATGGDVSIVDQISNLGLLSGDQIREANFCEVPPAKISGYVFQDGPVIVTSLSPDELDVADFRDGVRDASDTPLPGVRMQLRSKDGLPITTASALGGIYTSQFIEVLTDSRGYFEFAGLRAGSYSVYQVQPFEYIDGLDTPGTTGGYSVNKNHLSTDDEFVDLYDQLVQNPFTDPQFNAVLAIDITPGQHSTENNFSEVLIENPPTSTPPIERPPFPYERVTVGPETFPRYAPPPWSPEVWSPLPLIIGPGHVDTLTWHLSVINAGFPRGRYDGQPLDMEQVAKASEVLDVNSWEVRGLNQSTWRIVSTRPVKRDSMSRMVFDVPGATPLAGDFNGDGIDELALFINGEWFIDLNSNGRWDRADAWVKLGSDEDQPVLGDWDGDGKDDVGIFGRKWFGDERALAAEPGLPDPENIRRIKPKNLPPRPEEATEKQRLLQTSQAGPARSDLIDHVFRFGSSQDKAVSGDFNGDGISSIGIYREGKWVLDVDGDGLLILGRDKEVKFGEAGDQPLVGDFDGDGIDELAIVRGNQVIVDSNDNGRIDATDQVFLLDDSEGTVIAGDFDGDGKDEPALHQPTRKGPLLEARRTAG